MAELADAQDLKSCENISRAGSIPAGGTHIMLCHYSEKPFIFNPQKTYSQEDHFKPVGLWLSVEGENGWKEWCETENFHLNGLTFKTIFELSPDANILHITSEAELDNFSKIFALPNSKHDLRSINWHNVKNLYDGIIIAPYIWQRRHTLHTFWYYSWDCASGCIWNCSILKINETITVAQ